MNIFSKQKIGETAAIQIEGLHKNFGGYNR